MQLRRRVGAAGGAADDDASAGLDRSERVLPGRLADRLDDEVDAADLLRRSRRLGMGDGEVSAVATPPPIPQIRTQSPGRSCARVTSIRNAVS